MSKRMGWSLVTVCAVIVVAALIVHSAQRETTNSSEQITSSAPPNAFANYVNVRFAYSLCYPPQLLAPQGEAADGDGQKFVSGDGQAVAIAYGSNNALGQSLQQVFDQDTQGVTVNTKNVDVNTFTFSGTSSGLTVVEKTLVQDQVVKTVNIKFPTAMMATYVPIAERMVACFADTAPTQYSH
jgi:hypothetical protein